LSYSFLERDGDGWASRSVSNYTYGPCLDGGQDAYGGNQMRAEYTFTLPAAITRTKLTFSVQGRNRAGRAQIGFYWDG
jgi:hypothetical protein